jgi:hypothetical protein
MPAAKPAATATTALTLDERIAIATAPGWRPTESEEKLIENATVVGLRMHEHEEYGKTPVVVYRKTDGTFISVYAFHTVLRERLAELKTGIGSVHTIKYLGAQTSNTRKDLNGDPQRYESYYVEIPGQEVAAVSEDFAF